MDIRYFSEKVVEWYLEHKRDLPWRKTIDPYEIWLSEIILQQTRVSQGLPYYVNFVQTFPDVFALAHAEEEKVLRLWQGLGYYSRARNLHKCAKYVVKELNGAFPTTYDGLKSLPGVGDYTAAAIASFCYKEKIAVLDGNVYRVLSRIFGERTPVNIPDGKKIFFKLANHLISVDSPDLHNQATMEFGAIWCTPKHPKCDSCIFQSSCFAFKNQMQQDFPVKIRSRKIKKRFFNYFVVRKGKSLMMRQRKEKDIWQGLFDFYLVETHRSVRPTSLIENDDFLKDRFSVDDAVISAGYKNVLTHQTIVSKFVILNDESEMRAEEDALKYYSIKKIEELPKPVLITKFLKDYKFL